ncbi:hypothetical protein SE15_05725 [Thermanaerothrix daxensis]|uniref:Cell envelope-related transcriptional attenuator domain-containing protein n=1 Tax=Thermanaerothrix daxensis TaxID=869279 RepID=A0A0P6Y577_9CHLR|nr:hypothetical protein [Thermanaerothrix daxensis]KPL84572.1 hypothetical protein SE15_05725 [Thermanaerothrix daxensis]
MGKRLGILLPLVFLVCLVLGYLTNRYLIQNSRAGIARPTTPPLPTLPNQRNLLVIIVDDLTHSRPEIQSLWALIIYYPQHKLIFQPLPPVLLPEKSPPNFVNIRTEDGNISSLFLQQTTQAYRIPWQDYLVLDNIALISLSHWAQVRNPASSSTPEISPEKAFAQICNRLQGSIEALADLMEQQIQISEHFHSSLTLETALEIRHKLEATPGPSLECQVFEP